MAESVSNPLTLVMNVKSGARPMLEAVIKQASAAGGNNRIGDALSTLGMVHFAHFVFVNDTQFAVITDYDGSFKEYVDAFVGQIGPIFDALLKFVENPPATPVADHPEEFLKFVAEFDRPCVVPFYSAYPNLKVQDILTMKRAADGTKH